MSLSAAELAAVVAELQPLVGGTIQKIRAPAPRTALIELRVPGATHTLLVGAEVDETRLHLTLSRPPSPQPPLPLQNLLRAHLLPSRLVALEAVEGERIATLRFETPAGPRTLIAELIGRHGNLILVGEDDRIVGVAIPSASSTRAILPGQRYVPPPPAPPGTKAPRPPRFGAQRARPSATSFPISLEIEAFYGPLARERGLAERRRDAARGLLGARKRVDTALAKLEGESARAVGAEELRRYGDLLRPIASKIPRGASSAQAIEYTEAGAVEVEIPLRPELSGRENLERYYKQYRRMHAARDRIAARRAELESRRVALDALAAELAVADDEEVIASLLRQAASLGAGRRVQGRRARDEVRSPYRGFVSSSGRPIWVGRGSRENDTLTFRVAKGNDLWLHARGVTGAHVIVPVAKGAALDEQTLLDACALAAHYSGARGEAVAEIAYTHVRNVRKPKGSAPGAVVFAQERVMAFRHDAERIERLLAQPPA